MLVQIHCGVRGGSTRVCVCFECVVFGVILLLNAMIHNSPAYSRDKNKLKKGNSCLVTC